MSGEPSVFLVGNPAAIRLVKALQELSVVEPRFVLVGGLAVMARLSEAHRVTQDLDTLVAGVGFTTAVAMLPTGRSEQGVLSVGEVKVDVMEIAVDTSWDEIADLDEPIDRLFTGAHLWAMQTAAPLRISVEDASAVVPVASVPALLATKLHAYSSPRRNPEKRPNDAVDILRLGRMLVRQPHLVPVDVPSPVAEAVRWAMASWQRAPNEVVRRLRSAGASAPSVVEDEVRALAELLLDCFAASSPEG